MTSSLKLSEAIRLGSMLRQQGFSGSMDGKGTCALAAAAEACGIEPIRLSHGLNVDYAALAGRFPFLRDRADAPCDCGLGAYAPTAEWVVWHLNDQHHWTREQIADWVATVEPQDAAITRPDIPAHAEAIPR